MADCNPGQDRPGNHLLASCIPEAFSRIERREDMDRLADDLHRMAEHARRAWIAADRLRVVRDG